MSLNETIPTLEGDASFGAYVARLLNVDADEAWRVQKAYFHAHGTTLSGLIAAERDGRHLIYRASIPLMNNLLGFLTAHCCQGQPCLTTATPTCTNR